MFLNVYTIIVYIAWFIFTIVFEVKIGLIIKKYRGFTSFGELRNMMSKTDKQKIRMYFRYLAFSCLVVFMILFIMAEIIAPPRE
jgi:hypothetical protein